MWRTVPTAMLFLWLSCSAQAMRPRTAIVPDTVVPARFSVRNVALINAGIYGGSLAALYAAWYRNYPMGRFHTFNDGDEWKQMDKVGHVFGAYTMGRYSLGLWKHTSLSRTKQVWIGGLSGAMYQTAVEVLDGFSTQWGWSWTDMAANLLGSGLLISQELAWQQQYIQLKVSFHRLSYSDEGLNRRSNEIFGTSLPERLLKDYNGQVYWLSGNLHALMPGSRIPEWLNLSLGMGARGLFGARENIGRDASGQVTFDRTDIRRERRWLLSPDIDLTRIRCRSKTLRTLLFILNAVKIPAPTLEYGRSGWRWHWIYF